MMKTRRSGKNRAQRDAKRLHVHEAAGAAVGAIAGAGMGVLAAGPPGLIAGALIGAGAGALTSWANEANNVELANRDRQLDAEIGVSKGDLGVPGLKHPPGQVGAYSAASVGLAGTDDPVLSEGPILPPPD